MPLEQKHGKTFERINESLFTRGRGRPGGSIHSFTPSLFKAGPARGSKRHKLSPLSTPAQEEDGDSLGVTHLLHPSPFRKPTNEPKPAHSSCKGTIGKATGWEFPVNPLFHFKSSSWHLADE